MAWTKLTILVLKLILTIIFVKYLDLKRMFLFLQTGTEHFIKSTGNIIKRCRKAKGALYISWFVFLFSLLYRGEPNQVHNEAYATIRLKIIKH